MAKLDQYSEEEMMQISKDNPELYNELHDEWEEEQINIMFPEGREDD